jgi:hypothetical protein
VTDLQTILDGIPILGFFALFAVASLAAYEIGFRAGRWWQARTERVSEGPTSMLVGSILALLAFILAVTMGMASDRYDTRRALVLEEANDIGTTYLRAGFLPDAEAAQVRALLREYVPLRVNVPDRAQLEANFARSVEIHDELWAITESVVPDVVDSESSSTFIQSLNDMIDIHESRSTALLTSRVPPTILAVLVVGTILTLAMVGYSAGLANHRSLMTAAVLIIALGAVTTLIVDLDRPRDGFLQVSQQPLIDLDREMGAEG